MLDADLAVLYGVTTKRLNEQVKRNRDRFPADFMFRLTGRETAALRSQVATTKSGRGGRRSPPVAFTEHGAVMLASVLNSPTAVDASIRVVFDAIRELMQPPIPPRKRIGFTAGPAKQSRTGSGIGACHSTGGR